MAYFSLWKVLSATLVFNIAYSTDISSFLFTATPFPFQVKELSASIVNPRVDILSITQTFLSHWEWQGDNHIQTGGNLEAI